MQPACRVFQTCSAPLLQHHAHSTSSSNSCRPSSQLHQTSQNDVSAIGAKHGSINDSEVIRDLRGQLKKAQDAQKEMATSLELFKSVPREQRDKVALLQSEQKLRSEVAELRAEVGRLREREKRVCGATGGEEALRRIRKLEETLHSYQVSCASCQKVLENITLFSSFRLLES